MVYRLDLMALRTAYEALAAQAVEVTEVSDTRVKGNVDVTQAGRLIFFPSRMRMAGRCMWTERKRTVRRLAALLSAPI